MPLDNKKNKASTDIIRQPNRIGRATRIKGDISSEADFRIDGTLEGSITTSGRVVIGKEGVVEGQALCRDADIEGTFSGALNVLELLTLRASAVIEGDVIVAKLSVEPGATFNGTCSMKKAPVKALNNDLSEKTEKTA
ncbi:MAG: polymer-forming cytoskeletal protein [Sinomicrobium sp.]|nr:polymer-forming cytoskeletal protein [Sinomicrobium sp.]